MQYCDVVPTLLELAGDDAPESSVDGVSFADVLKGGHSSRRKFAYGMHNNVPEGPPYPIRTVTDGEFRFIRNLTPNELYIEKHLMGTRGTGELNNPYWGTWTWKTQEDPATYRLVKRYMLRPPVQFYHTAKDPYELNNLADAPDLRERRQSFAVELQKWMQAQGDPGQPQDTQQALQAARKGKHTFFPQD